MNSVTGMLEMTWSAAMNSVWPSCAIVDPEDAIAVAGDLDDVAAQPHDASAMLDLAAERLPHHARAQLRVLELLDQAGDRVPRLEEPAQQGGPERQVLDSLGGPFRLQLGAGNAPDLLRVRLEEQSGTGGGRIGW